MGQTFTTDIIVVGGGTAGSFFACRMAQRGYQDLVFEKKLADLGKAIEISTRKRCDLKNLPCLIQSLPNSSTLKR